MGVEEFCKEVGRKETQARPIWSKLAILFKMGQRRS